MQLVVPPFADFRLASLKISSLRAFSAPRLSMEVRVQPGLRWTEADAASSSLRGWSSVSSNPAPYYGSGSVSMHL
eukprot:1270899-Rhodomonas_salina.3